MHPLFCLAAAGLILLVSGCTATPSADQRVDQSATAPHENVAQSALTIRFGELNVREGELIGQMVATHFLISDIRFDIDALDEEHAPLLTRRVGLKARNVTPIDAVSRLLWQVSSEDGPGFDLVQTDHGYLVTTSKRANAVRQVRSYDVGKLIAAAKPFCEKPAAPATRESDTPVERSNLKPATSADSLRSLLTYAVATGTWAVAGERGDRAAHAPWMALDGDVLIIAQTSANHRKIERFLKAMEAADDPDTQARLGGLLYPAPDALAGLDKELPTVRFEKTPLDAAVEQTATQAGLNLCVRWSRLEEVGISRGKPITLKADRAKAWEVLRSVLRLASEDAQQWAAYSVAEDGFVEIDTRASDAEYVFTVRDIVGSPKPPAGISLLRQTDPEMTPERWRDMSVEDRASAVLRAMTSFVRPNSWAVFAGGPNSTLVFKSGIIAVEQPPDGALEVAAFFDSLRTGKNLERWKLPAVND